MTALIKTINNIWLNTDTGKTSIFSGRGYHCEPKSLTTAMHTTHSSTEPYRLTTTAPLTPCANALMKSTVFQQNFLQLNKDKTEVIAFGNKDEVLKVNAHLDARGLKTKNQVRNLGVILESDISFNSLVKAITKSAY